MTPLLFLAAASSELDALGAGVTQCDRRSVNPVFMAEAGRRSRFMLDAYRDQEAIVADRRTLADQRRVQREGAGVTAADDKKMKLSEAAVEDRQRALNDERMLEGIRESTVDSLRHYFLSNCPVDDDKKK